MKGTGAAIAFSWDSEITIEGTSNEELSSLVITVNGVASSNLQPSTSNFSEEVTLQPGSNAIVIEAKDLAGNLSQTSLSITYDNIAPTITVTTPEEGALFNQINITLTGTVDDLDAKIWINDIDTQVQEDGTWAGEIQLQEGENSLLIRAQDLVGNESSITLDLTLDTQAPVITLNPDGGTLNTNSPTLIVSYTDEGSGLNLETLNITLDGSDITNQFTIHSSNSQLSTSNLSEGNH
ncbi:MAG: hypothetical protein HYS08_03525, partial [Chlamydiae bacterium]|nr:hypothetical protein [Chlamydiota bacterium]